MKLKFKIKGENQIISSAYLSREQDSFIINFNQQYPYTITTGFNLNTGEITPTQYIFTSRRVDKKIQDFYTLRRDGLIKNSLTIL